MRLLENAKSTFPSLLGATDEAVGEADDIKSSRLRRATGLVEAIGGVIAGGSHGSGDEYVPCGWEGRAHKFAGQQSNCRAGISVP